MKKHRDLVMIMAALGLSAVMTGCYTQVESARADQDYGYSSQDRERGEYGSSDSHAGYDTTYADSSAYVDDDTYDNARHHFYYDSYYPAISYGFGYYDPWWRPGLYVGYAPFGWCGTYDPWYYAGWYAPIFFPGYSGYYHHYYGGGARAYGRTRGGGASRTFGVTRGGAAVYRTPSQLGATAVGRYAPGRTTSPTTNPQGRTMTGRQGVGGSRSSAVGRPSARGTVRGGSRPMQVRPRSVAPPLRGYRDGGSTRGGRSYSPPPSRGGRSYSPPPSRGGRSYSPPPSRGGGSHAGRGSSGGSRGSSGSSRGSSGGSRGGGRR